MGQETKKSPTPSTAKKTGAELPMDSPKGTPSSVPPAVLRRLLTVADVDVNDFHDMMGDAQSHAERRVARLLDRLSDGAEVGSAAAAAVDSFLVSVLRSTSPAEIVLRGGAAPAFARLEAEMVRNGTRERALRGAR